jgi:uncharacterized membrane protein
MYLFIQIVLLLGSPVFFLYLEKKKLLPGFLGPVVLSYVFGIFMASIQLIPLNNEMSKVFSEGTVLIAIPLLLFSTDIKSWVKDAKSTVLSFICCVFAAAFVTSVVSLYSGQLFPELWKASGMIAGVNTGGTPNMQAVGLALGASDQLFVQLNAADILYGGFYLLFLTSFAKPLLSKIYPEYIHMGELEQAKENDQEFKVKQVVIASVLSVLIVLLSVGLVMGLFGNLEKVAIIILLITTLAVGASFSERIRNLKGAFSFGNYLLLVFCVAIGMRSEASQILNNSTHILYFYGQIYFFTILVHYILAYFLKIDRDTVLITSTASIYGPAFVGQIAQVLDNRHIVFGGMATGLIGYAIGNYLGIGIAYLVHYLQ